MLGCRAGSRSAAPPSSESRKWTRGLTPSLEDLGVVVEVAGGVEVGPRRADGPGRVSQEVQTGLVAGADDVVVVRAGTTRRRRTARTGSARAVAPVRGSGTRLGAGRACGVVLDSWQRPDATARPAPGTAAPPTFGLSAPSAELGDPGLAHLPRAARLGQLLAQPAELVGKPRDRLVALVGWHAGTISQAGPWEPGLRRGLLPDGVGAALGHGPKDLNRRYHEKFHSRPTPIATDLGSQTVRRSAAIVGKRASRRSPTKRITTGWITQSPTAVTRINGPRVLRTLCVDRKVHDRLTRKLNVMPALVDTKIGEEERNAQQREQPEDREVDRRVHDPDKREAPQGRSRGSRHGRPGSPW